MATEITITEFGLYETATGGSRPAEKTVTGATNLITHHRLIRRAEVIAAQPGRSFGVRYRISGRFDSVSRLTYRILHPPLTNPATGKTMTVSEWSSPVASYGLRRYIGYSFDHGWEMAEGLWTIQILHRGHVLAEKTFKIVIPLN
ncbi:MAG: DUF3859 domain-containing protein [Pseudomonadota bacterium]